MNFNFLIIVLLCFAFIACINGQLSNTTKAGAPVIQNKGHELVYDMVQKVGNYADLLKGNWTNIEFDTNLSKDDFEKEL